MKFEYEGINDFVAAKFKNNVYGNGMMFRVGESNLFTKVYEDGCCGGSHVVIDIDDNITDKFYPGDKITITF